MLFAAACATWKACLIENFRFSCLTHRCGKHTDRVEGQPSDEEVQDDSWAGEMGLQKGLSAAALTWALLSESQDALLTHAIKQVCRQLHIQTREAVLCSEVADSFRMQQASSTGCIGYKGFF